MLKKRIIPCLDIQNGRTVKGVNFDTTTNKWLVRHMQDGKQKYFGRYATMAEAEQIASNNKAKLAAGEAVGGLKVVESVAGAPQPVAVPMPPVALATIYIYIYIHQRHNLSLM